MTNKDASQAVIEPDLAETKEKLTPEQMVVDPGLDETIKKLTPEQISHQNWSNN